MTNSSSGIIDTNIFIHALTNDGHGEDCRAFLRQVQSGERTVLLSTVVVHEFTYAVARYRKQMTRKDIGDYLITLMILPGVQIEDPYLFDAVRVWANSPSLGFVDACLAVRAERERVPVYTKNIKHFRDFDIEVPDPLSS